MSEDDEEEITDIAKNLGLSKVIPELYKDAVRPAAKELGGSLETMAKAINIALRPLAGLVWGYEQFEQFLLNELPKKLRDRKTKKVITPDPHIAGPLLESIKFSGSKPPLREMYLNLLSTSMDKETALKAHPSFVEIIRQLSPDEAKVLAYLPQLRGYPEVASDWVTVIFSRHKVFEALKRTFGKVCCDAAVDFPDSYLRYLDNLFRLRLLDVSQEVDRPQLKEGKLSLGGQGRGTLSFEQSSHERLYVTDFGQQFIEACLSDVSKND